eukprot:gene13339-19178_t
MASIPPWGDEFTLKERKHYDGAQRDNLNPGMMPEEPSQAGITGHHIARNRALHDTSAMGGSSNNQGGAGADPSASNRKQDSLEQWQSSYQAQTSGQTNQQQRRSGKRTYNAPGSTSGGGVNFGGGGSFFSGGPALGDRMGLTAVPPDLMHGTTRATNLVPGYTAHIPKAAGMGHTVTEKSNDMSLIMKN